MKKAIQLAGIRILISPVYLFIFFLLYGCSNMNNPTDTKTSNSTTQTQGANEVYIQNMAFSPASLTITAGTTVTWTNKDMVKHTVTSDVTLFDSGSIMTDGVYSYTFINAGTYSYHCSIHSTMKATIIVNAYVPSSGY